MTAVAALPSFLSAQTVRENVAVEVITVRLTARDSAGRRVEDLTLADLSLTVDGKPVVIETLSQPAAAAPAVARQDGNAGSTAAPSVLAARPAPERSIQTLIFIDTGGTHVFDRRDVCDELERYVRASGSGNEQFLVGRFDGEGMTTASSWTRDGAAVAAQIHEIGHKSKENWIWSPNAMPVFSASDPANGSLMQLQIHREHMFEALLEALATFPDEIAERRLLLVGGGAALLRPDDLAARVQDRTSSRYEIPRDGADPAPGHPSDFAGERRATFALWSRAVNAPAGDELSLSDVTAKALERDVAVIPVQAEAFDRGEFDMGSGSLGSPVLSGHLSAGQSMSELAENTGAEPILVHKKASSRLSEINERAAYTLTFRDPAGDHRKHKIEVTCKRPGVRINYRRGFRIPTDDERALDTVIARFRRPEMGADPMAAVLVPSPAEGKGGRATTRLDIKYAPPLETGALGEREIKVIAVGEDDQGNRTEPIQWNGTADRVEGAKTFEAAMMMGAKPGTYTWSVALRDEPTGLTSFVVVPAGQKR